MATVNIGQQFLNENKRYSEGVAVTFPSVLNVGGGRSNATPTYMKVADVHEAEVVEPDTIMKKAYLIVDEAFPANAVLAASVGADAVFAAVDLTVVGLVVSTTVDKLYTAKAKVTATITGTGLTAGDDLTTGKLRIVLATEHPSLMNGQYAS